MWQQIQRTVSLLIITALLGFTLLCSLLAAPSALAEIGQFEEAPGHVLYKSRQTLWDGHGHSWQAIAFQRSQPDASFHIYLRLVAFPGTADIDRSQPLVLTNLIGETFKAADNSGQIFTNASSPEPNVGQYNLQPILDQLRTDVSWRLQIPLSQHATTTLFAPSTVVQEWHTLATQIS